MLLDMISIKLDIDENEIQKCKDEILGFINRGQTLEDAYAYYINEYAASESNEIKDNPNMLSRVIICCVLIENLFAKNHMNTCGWYLDKSDIVPQWAKKNFSPEDL